MSEKEKNKGKSAGYKWLTGIVATLFGVLLVSGLFLLNENSAMAVEPAKETIKNANSPKADLVETGNE